MTSSTLESLLAQASSPSHEWVNVSFLFREQKTLFKISPSKFRKAAVIGKKTSAERIVTPVPASWKTNDILLPIEILPTVLVMYSGSTGQSLLQLLQKPVKTYLEAAQTATPNRLQTPPAAKRTRSQQATPGTISSPSTPNNKRQRVVPAADSISRRLFHSPPSSVPCSPSMPRSPFNPQAVPPSSSALVPSESQIDLVLTTAKTQPSLLLRLAAVVGAAVNKELVEATTSCKQKTGNPLCLQDLAFYRTVGERYQQKQLKMPILTTVINLGTGARDELQPEQRCSWRLNSIDCLEKALNLQSTSIEALAN